MSSDHARTIGLIFGRWYCASRILATNTNPVPSGQEGSGTFWRATWNIVNEKGGRITKVATGLVQLGMGVGVLTEIKFVHD